MRNFDNYEQIHDNEGNLLIGKLVFCRKGTTTPEPVYAWDSEHNDYVAINPEVLININGRPDQQIYLSDTDYTIYVYKYIGSGEMDQDSDLDNWLPQYSFNNLYLTFGVDIKTDSPYLVSNMTELQETDPANVGVTAGKTLVCLGGYNALGDCPPVFYYWDDLSTKTANGVDIVAVTGISVGRWLLVNTFTEIGFDVRHAGCFAEKTADETSINQSYAIQRADTYALKYGLKIVFPDLFSDTYSYYLLTNLIINSEVVAADGVKLLTATSATLNFVSEENLKKKVPFILHDGTYSGTWSVKGETIRTGYFENQESLSNTNWPPTITANKKYIYDASFNCYGTTPNISLSGKEVVFNLLLENEKYTLTNCKIESFGKIKHACSFTNCEIKGSFFDNSLTARQIGDFTFVSCDSCLDSWESVNKYVVFKIVQGDDLLDLQGKTCSLNWSSYGGGLYYPFPFTKVCNAVFTNLTIFPIDKDGNKKTSFLLENVTMIHLELSPNDVLLNWNIESSSIIVYRNNSGAIQNAKITAYNSEFVGGSIVAKTFNFFGCTITNELETPPTAALAAIFDNCSIFSIISLFSSSTFNITFTNNVISNGAFLYLLGSSSNQTFVNSVFTNNTIKDGPREFIRHAVAWNFSNIGNYEYRNNTGTIKAEDKIKLALRIPYYHLGATIPDGTKRYLEQIGASSSLVRGLTFNDLFFSFGENTRNDLFIQVVPQEIDGADPYLKDYNSSLVVQNTNYDKVYGSIDLGIILRKGVGAAQSLPYDTIRVDYNNLSDGDLVSIVVSVEKIYRADATSEILK